MDGSLAILLLWKRLNNLAEVRVFSGELDEERKLEKQFVKSDDMSMENSFDTSSGKIEYTAYLHRTAPQTSPV